MSQRFIIEMGMGTDQYGQDYTKAARRAIKDALGHSSIPMFDALGMDHMQMRVQVTVAVQEPDQVDWTALQALMPRGRAQVKTVFGGLNSRNPDTGNVIVVAQAAVEAFLDRQG